MWQWWTSIQDGHGSPAGDRSVMYRKLRDAQRLAAYGTKPARPTET